MRKANKASIEFNVTIDKEFHEKFSAIAGSIPVPTRRLLKIYVEQHAKEILAWGEKFLKGAQG